MNANELADLLNEWYKYSYKNMCNEAATMLRQQQAEIEALKKELKRIKFAWNMAENELERYLVKVKAQEK